MKLDDTHKKNVFKVPDQYFEEFPGRLQERILEETDQGRGKLISFPSYIRVAVAASILILITFFLFLLQNNHPSVEELLSDVPTESLITYLEESDMSVDELMETIDVQLISSEEVLPEPTVIPDETIDEDMIQDIIIDYNLDMEM
jgi:hypothetical protein